MPRTSRCRNCDDGGILNSVKKLDLFVQVLVKKYATTSKRATTNIFEAFRAEV